MNLISNFLGKSNGVSLVSDNLLNYSISLFPISLLKFCNLHILSLSSQGKETKLTPVGKSDLISVCRTDFQSPLSIFRLLQHNSVA